jgi:hypothetical protein
MVGRFARCLIMEQTFLLTLLIREGTASNFPEGYLENDSLCPLYKIVPRTGIPGDNLAVQRVAGLQIGREARVPCRIVRSRLLVDYLPSHTTATVDPAQYP